MFGTGNNPADPDREPADPDREPADPDRDPDLDLIRSWLAALANLS